MMDPCVIMMIPYSGNKSYRKRLLPTHCTRITKKQMNLLKLMDKDLELVSFITHLLQTTQWEIYWKITYQKLNNPVSLNKIMSRMRSITSQIHLIWLSSLDTGLLTRSQITLCLMLNIIILSSLLVTNVIKDLHQIYTTLLSGLLFKLTPHISEELCNHLM